jgi:hypothetical protein
MGKKKDMKDKDLNYQFLPVRSYNGVVSSSPPRPDR